MKMKTITLAIVTLVFLTNDLTGQIGRLALSPLQKTELKLGLTDISIVYSRPSMRGREIFGGLVPYDQLWRTGANRNTNIEFSEDVIIGGKKVKQGKYALFTIPSRDQWEAIFYNDTSNWDVPEEMDESKIVATITVDSELQKSHTEVLDISIGDFTNYNFDLNIRWSNTAISIPIELNTRKMMESKIKRTLNGPSYNDYYSAAVYEMESGEDFARGLNWINMAMEMTDEVTFWDLRVKAILLMKMGDNPKALKVAKEGLEMAEEIGSSYGTSEFKKVLNKVDK